MTISSLDNLRRRNSLVTKLGNHLPEDIPYSDYAFKKSFKVVERFRKKYDSKEWYGLTLGTLAAPMDIYDIGIPPNNKNYNAYTQIIPEMIGEYIETLDPKLVVNGWVHSHGHLNYRQFSGTDYDNMRVVHNFVSSRIEFPLEKRERLVNNLSILIEGQYSLKDLNNGSLTLIVDQPIKQARILDTLLGSFSYHVVIGEGGWHCAEILYGFRDLLSGKDMEIKRKTGPDLLRRVNDGRKFGRSATRKLYRELDEKISIRKSVSPPEPDKPKFKGVGWKIFEKDDVPELKKIP